MTARRHEMRAVPDGDGDGGRSRWVEWRCSRCGWGALAARGDPPPDTVNVYGRHGGQAHVSALRVADCDEGLAARVMSW